MTRLRDWSARDLDAAYAAGSEMDPAYEWNGPAWGRCDQCGRRDYIGEDGMCPSCIVAWQKAWSERSGSKPDPWAEAS